MKPILLLSMALLLFFGCAGAQTKTNATESGAINNTTAAPGGSMPAATYQNANTSDLSFSRNASGVMNANTTFAERPSYDFANITTGDGRLIVYYFFSSSCSACKALRPEIDRLEAKYGGVEWEEFDINTQNGTYAYQDFAAQFNLSSKQRLVPQVLVNGTIITDRFNINKSLEEIISAFSPS